MEDDNDGKTDAASSTWAMLNMYANVTSKSLLVLFIFAFFCRRIESIYETETQATATEQREDNNGEDNDILTFAFEPRQLRLFEDSIGHVKINYSFPRADTRTLNLISSYVLEINVTPESKHVADVSGNKTSFTLDEHIGRSKDELINHTFAQNISFSVKGIRLGYCLFSFQIKLIPVTSSMNGTPDKNYAYLSPLESSTNVSWEDMYTTREYNHSVKYRVGVMRKPSTLDHVFIAIVISLVAVSTISMGCAVDLTVVKDVLKKPIAPAIGFASQFVIMPLLAYTLCQIFSFRGNAGLGFFASGCAPGGGSSNKFSLPLDGDVSLSVTMTLLSTVASLGMIPLWLFTLGQTFVKEATTDINIKIPFENIVFTLVSIFVTVGIGVFFKYKVSKVAKFLLKIVRPLLIIITVFLSAFTLWANWYVFSFFTPGLIFAGMSLPWIGFLLGGVIAAVLRQPWYRIKTIAIETGIQNTGVPVMLLKFSLPAPDSDLAMVAIIAANVFTSTPLWFAVAYVEIKKRFCKSKGEEEENDENVKEKLEVSEDVVVLNPEKILYLDRETTI